MVQNHAAIVSGQVKRSYAEPTQTCHTYGDNILAVRSKADGTWEAKVTPGRYVVQAFSISWGDV